MELALVELVASLIQQILNYNLLKSADCQDKLLNIKEISLLLGPVFLADYEPVLAISLQVGMVANNPQATALTATIHSEITLR